MFTTEPWNVILITIIFFAIIVIAWNISGKILKIQKTEDQDKSL